MYGNVNYFSLTDGNKYIFTTVILRNDDQFTVHPNEIDIAFEVLIKPYSTLLRSKMATQLLASTLTYFHRVDLHGKTADEADVFIYLIKLMPEYNDLISNLFCILH